MDMDISDKKVFFDGEDLPLSWIVKFFEPQNKVAKKFILESANLSYEGQLLTAIKSEKKVKKDIAVCTAPKGETLQGFLKVISGEGWSYASISDWYRYYIKLHSSEMGGVYVPGTIYTDVNSNGWIPFIFPLKKVSLLRRFIKKARIAKIFMEPVGSLIEFQTERQILVSRIVKEPKGPS